MLGNELDSPTPSNPTAPSNQAPISASPAKVARQNNASETPQGTTRDLYEQLGISWDDENQAEEEPRMSVREETGRGSQGFRESGQASSGRGTGEKARQGNEDEHFVSLVSLFIGGKWGSLLTCLCLRKGLYSFGTIPLHASTK